MPRKKIQKISKCRGTGSLGNNNNINGETEGAAPSRSTTNVPDLPDLSSELKEKCSVCSLPAPKRCGRCKEKFYCSGEHQRVDWKGHKVNCRSLIGTREPGPVPKEKSRPSLGYRIESVSEEQGVCVIADRDFEEGELILEEKPALILPVQAYGKEEKCLMSCFGCFKAIWGALYRCSKCGIPMCGSACERAPMHRDQECKVIKGMEGKLRIRGLSSDVKILQLYLDICVLRVLIYRRKSGEGWEELGRLEKTPRMAFHKRCPIYGKEILTDPKHGFGLNLSLKFAEGNQDLVMEASHLLFSHWDTLLASDVSPNMRALFPKIGSLSHSCLPNTVYSQMRKDSISMSLKAGRRILKGEILTRNYSFDPWADTLSRREILLQKSIVCICARCRDPTEFGSNSAGIRCHECTSGLFLPQYPLSPVLVWNERVVPIKEFKDLENLKNFKTQLPDSASSAPGLRELVTIEEAILIGNLIQEQERFIEEGGEEDSNPPTNNGASVRKESGESSKIVEDSLEDRPGCLYQIMDTWRCNNSKCGLVIRPNYIHKLVEYVETEYKLMKLSCTTVLELGENIKQFLEKYDGLEVLGPYHRIILLAADDFLQAERSRLFYGQSGQSLTQDLDKDTEGRITLGLPPAWNQFELERFGSKLDYSGRLCSYLEMTKSFDISIHKGYAMGDFATSNLILQAWAYKAKRINSLEFHKSVRQSLEKLQEASKILLVFLASSQDYGYISFLETLIFRTLKIIRRNVDLAPKLLLEMLGMNLDDTLLGQDVEIK